MAIKTLTRRGVNNPRLEYVTDKKGKKTKVIMPIDEYESLLEDFHDLAVIAHRKNDKLLSFEKVLKDLKTNGSI